MRQITLGQVLSCPNLPSLPSVAIEVIHLTSKRNVELEEIAKVIQNDPALCVRILRTVNSSFYGLSKPCPTITRALAYLGLNTVKSLVLGFSLVDTANAGDDVNDLQDYWGRSLLSAAACRRLATLTNACDVEEAFLGALLQDIGILAIRRVAGASYRDVAVQGLANHMCLPRYCREAFGVDHPDVGAALALRWRLPPSMVEAIREHHCQLNDLLDKTPLIQLVALSNHLVSAITRCEPNDADLNDVRDTIETLFHVGRQAIDRLINQSVEDARELAKLLLVYIGAYPDVSAIIARAEDARIQHELEIQRESERLQQTNSDLIRLLLSDALTGAGNRKHFDAELNKSFGQTRSFQGCMALLMIDVDRFKSFNDTHGHQAGDAVLIELARRVISAVGESGVVCRYGGEEFAVILPGATIAAATKIAEDVRNAIADRPFETGVSAACDLRVTASVGVAVYDQTAAHLISTPQLLVHLADKAMYAAKQAGRNCVRVLGPRAIVAAA